MNKLTLTGSAVMLGALLALGGSLDASPASVGDPAPDFHLQDVNRKTQSLSEFKGKFVVLEWVNPECPFVRKHYDSGNMQRLQQAAAAQGVVWLSINSSGPGKQGHLTPEIGQEFLIARHAAPTALLLDSDGTVGHLYGAKTTPSMFVIDPKGTLIYAGAIDSVPSTDPDDVSKAVNYVQLALGEAMAGKPVTTSVTQSYGCSVKYQ